MPRPTARVLALLEILQGGGTHTVPRLAERLGVDERTVRRYVTHLLDLDVPVESVRGRHGGYRLAPGFRMPPLMPTDEEALAVVLALPAASSAAAKVRRVLPRPLAARLEALQATLEFTAPDRAAARAEAAVMLPLAEAARDRRPVLLSYTDRTGRRTDRTLHPYGIVAHSGRWYVTGLDSAADELRTFRLDRVASVRLAPGTFVVPSDFRPADAVLTSLAGTPWRHEVVVAVQAPADEVRSRLPPGLATIEPAPDGVLIRLRAERLDWLPAVLAGLGRPFVIHQPPELRDVVRAWAEQVAAWAATRAPA